jgi:hypothetical protein
MGTWGYHSYDNDAVSDVLAVGVQNLIETAKQQCRDTQPDVLVGVVIALLKARLHVPKEVCQEALGDVEQLMYDVGYINSFKSPSQKRMALWKEHALLRRSLGLRAIR